MARTLESFGIDKLSVEDRLLLVEAIWDSIAATPDLVPITPGQCQDLEQRLAAWEANPGAGSSWEEVKERLRDQASGGR